jgi:hypothetical protein
MRFSPRVLWLCKCKCRWTGRQQKKKRRGEDDEMMLARLPVVPALHTSSSFPLLPRSRPISVMTARAMMTVNAIKRANSIPHVCIKKNQKKKEGTRDVAWSPPEERERCTGLSAFFPLPSLHHVFFLGSVKPLLEPILDVCHSVCDPHSVIPSITLPLSLAIPIHQVKGAEEEVANPHPQPHTHASTHSPIILGIAYTLFLFFLCLSPACS